MKQITILIITFIIYLTANAQNITHYGNNAGTQGSYSSYFGYQAGKTTTGRYNTFIGGNSGRINTSGEFNVFVGSNTGYGIKTGLRNVFIGYAAGRYNIHGDNNTYIGFHAGYNNRSNDNVFLGYQAGYNELGSGKLYVANTSTSAPLIYGDFTSKIVGFNAGVGIGTQTPSANLHIEGNGSGVNLKIGNGSSVLQIASASCNGCFSGAAIPGDKIIRILGSNNLIFDTGGSNVNARAFKFVHQSSELLKIQHNGEVSIGNVTTPSGYKLFVEDGVLTEKVKVASVNSSDWADYVFEEDYDLNTTEEVEQFIKENKHLPNVPSAQEVSENGVDMVKMDATLLRQIEELWLQVIELKKENKALQVEITNLNN